MTEIDITFDVSSDTPEGKDVDSHSPTLRRYHQQLWSKPLPNGIDFQLNTDRPGTYLHHQSELGEFVLASDAIAHTFRVWKRMSSLITQVPASKIQSFVTVARTVGGYIVFPGKRIDNKPTINGMRGINPRIQDRFDLTLECVRRHYIDEPSPLTDVLQRYVSFFDLFEDFRGYVDFFLLQDLVNDNYSSIKFCLPFTQFEQSPLPSTVEEYLSYRGNIMSFVAGRNERIQRQANIIRKV